MSLPGPPPPWQAACPACGAAMGSFSADAEAHAGGQAAALCCGVCPATYPRAGGVWACLTPSDARRFAPFLADYHTVRRAEGRGSDDPAYYANLPAVPAGDPLAWQWAIRSRTWSHFAAQVLPTFGPGRLVVDVGAGVGWLSHRLAELGHHPIAVDLSVDGRDGLGAVEHYRSWGRTWPAVQANFDRLPLAPGQADVVVFNASLHYSTDYAATLTEALRVLAPGGAIVVLDSPLYRREESGRQMVAERHADFATRFGTRSDTVASVEYLTEARLDGLATELGLDFQRHRVWYGLRWSMRPLRARLRRAREPSRFVILVARRRTH